MRCEEDTYDLSGEAGVALRVDLGDEIIVKRELIIVRNNQIRIEVPKLFSSQHFSLVRLLSKTHIVDQIRRQRTSIRDERARTPTPSAQTSHVRHPIQPASHPARSRLRTRIHRTHHSAQAHTNSYQQYVLLSGHEARRTSSHGIRHLTMQSLSLVSEEAWADHERPSWC